MAESRNTVSNDGIQRNMDWSWQILRPISTSQQIFEMNTKMEKRGASGSENLEWKTYELKKKNYVNLC